MPTTEFDKIKSLAGWRAKLDELLGTARAAAQKDDLPPRLAAAERLTQFTIHSPPFLADDPAGADLFAELDRIARETRKALHLQTIEQRVFSIMERTSELAELRKRFENQVSANLQSAASIRLEKARKVVESTTAAVAAMIDLKRELDRAIEAGAADADVGALAKQVGALIEKLQAVRSEVETVL